MTSLIHCWTDGSANAKTGAWAYIITHKGEEIYSDSGAEFKVTNNMMELLAIINSLEFLQENYPNKKAAIMSDSAYAINGINDWMPNLWMKNKWKTSNGEPVKNKDLWLRLSQLALNPKYIFQKVKAHSDIEMNCKVDRLANSTRRKAIGIEEIYNGSIH